MHRYGQAHWPVSRIMEGSDNWPLGGHWIGQLPRYEDFLMKRPVGWPLGSPCLWSGLLACDKDPLIESPAGLTRGRPLARSEDHPRG
jgi:hypothetical protein